MLGTTYRVKRVDIVSDRRTAILNQKDAMELSLREQDRVKVSSDGEWVIAIVETTSTLVEPGEIGLLERCREALCVEENSEVRLMPAERPTSVEDIKKKLQGKELSKDEIVAIIDDIVKRKLSDIELSAYVTSVYINGMNMRETADLTRAMVDTGDTISFDTGPIYDFHSVGGAPGNKITLLVVPIVAAGGLLVPKTSSRAISSACGTADILEVLCPVTLKAHQIRSITERIGGVIAWGGGVNIAPADDLIIRAEYPLSIDPHPQLLASVMAKKKAVGAERLLMDIPMGPETKVPDEKIARGYAKDFISLGDMLDMHVECAITYGGQPIGRAIGPAAEAREALVALEGKPSPNSLLDKALGMAAILFSMDGHRDPLNYAKELLSSGKALAKFKEIIEAQGGDPDVTSETVKMGKYSAQVRATKDGYVSSVSNHAIVKMVRTAGAPKDKGAALVLEVKEGDAVDPGDVLFTLYADSERKLEKAVELSRKIKHLSVEGMILERIPAIHEVGGNR
ncbi:MAG: AMP phosphorylase [Thermoplasmata archaeon]|nr:AMP phosphorylase [Thermoplasmata archaeon]